MNKAHSARKPVGRRTILAIIAGLVGWLGLLFWGTHFWTPLEYSRPVTWWSVAGLFVVGLGFFTWTTRRSQRSSDRPQRRGQLALTIPLASAAAGMFVGVALASVLQGINGTFRSSEPFIVEGTVIGKYTANGRSTSYFVVVREQTPLRTLTFGFSRSAYEGVRVGDHFYSKLQVGFFGWPCRPR